jgi:hypothetical protein
MSESTTTSSELTSQYASQVSSDLERNIKEQERISAEIVALQEQLATLQHDHAVLVNMQHALGIDDAAVPAPRRKSSDEPGAGKRARAKKPTAAQGRTTVRKAAAKKSAAKAAVVTADQPTLVELVRGHLTGQSEPRSAAEVSTALGQAHPERGIKTTVVRSTLEGLVARKQAQRTKQGTSVFYTAGDAAEPAAEREGEGEGSA